MQKLKRLLPFLAIALAAAVLLRLSTYGWNFLAPSYPGGETATSPEALRETVTELAVNIGPRDLFRNNRPRLRMAEKYLTERFRAAGCAVEFQEYLAAGVKVRNIACEKKGATVPGEIILFGAHYDTFNNPGADDNASGIATILELAEYARGKSYSRTLKFVAFVNEEPPFFQKEDMGSRVYASAAREKGEDIRAAIVMDTVGYFSEEKFSQRYPILLGTFLPPRGNFIAQISDFGSRGLARRIDRAFRDGSRLPLRTLFLPSFVPGADFSDHSSFWRYDYPAVMFTDTAFYRMPHYHKASDLPETLNYEYMAAFVDGLKASMDALAGGRKAQREKK